MSPSSSESAVKLCSSGRTSGRVKRVLAQFIRKRRTDPIFNFSLRDERCSPYLQDHGSRASDLRCVELSFFDFVRQLDSTQCYFRIPEHLEPQRRVTSLRRHSVILLNHVIQALVGPDERLSGQDDNEKSGGDSGSAVESAR